MHPGPMNRGLEISADVADSPEPSSWSRWPTASTYAWRACICFSVALDRRQVGTDGCDCPSRRGPYGLDPDIVVEDGVITEMTPSNQSGSDALDAEGVELELDASGCTVMPGLVDLHTPSRTGREDAETIATGSQAAAMGGFTCVHTMANTSPVADTAGVVEQVWRRGVEAGIVDVRPVGAVTVGLRVSSWRNSAPWRRALHLFGCSAMTACVFTTHRMRRALEYVKTSTAWSLNTRRPSAHRGGADERGCAVSSPWSRGVASCRGGRDHRSRRPVGRARGPTARMSRIDSRFG